jgi:tripeptidyl-peptidase-1
MLREFSARPARMVAVGILVLSLACTASAQCSASSCSSCISQGCQWCYGASSGSAASCIPKTSNCFAGGACGITSSCPANPQMGVFALNQDNVPQLQSQVRDMSSPSSPKYGQWMSRQAVLGLIAPSASAQTAVVQWIQSFGATTNNQQDSIYFTATPEATVQMFGSAVCNMLVQPPSPSTACQGAGSNGKRTKNKKRPQTLGTSLDGIPPNIAQYIAIWELLQIPAASQPNAYSTCGGQAGYGGCSNSPVATPPFYSQLYNMVNMSVTNPLTNLSTQLYVGSTSYASQDMQTFANLYNVQLGTVTSQPYYIPTGDVEASLDMETSTAVANGVQTVWWWAPGSWVYTMANTIFNTPNAPLVHSWSFGWEEDLQCVGLSPACNFSSAIYIARTEIELMKLAAIGMTVIVASGDQGIASANNQACPPTAGPYLASYPQTSAWVLTAGATMMGGSSPPYTPEVVCSYATGALITTGGGYSAYVPQPWWQVGVSDAYGTSQVQQGLVPATAFNSAFRGFPDVAALGHNFVVCDGSMGSSGYT